MHLLRLLDARKQDPAGGDHRPAGGAGKRGQHGGRPELPGHLELGPVAAHGLADAVQDPTAAKTQNRVGIPALAPARSPASWAADSNGKPHQNPRPTKIATNTGASAVPSPSSALRVSTEVSTLVGWNTAVRIFSG